MVDVKDEKSKVQAIHDKVMNAPEWVLLSRMRLFGFWPKGQGIPEDPVDEAKERAGLEQQRKLLLAATFTGEAALQVALDAEHKRRTTESRKKRAERIEARQREATERRSAWARERTQRIVFLGEGVSAGLEDVASDAGQAILDKYGFLAP